MQKGNLF